MSGVLERPNGEIPGVTMLEDFPIQQARVRALIGHYREIDAIPGVDVKLDIEALELALRRSVAAAASGDGLRMLNSYEELKGCE